MNPPLEDIAYLARSDHRVPTLIALTERPRTRSELCELNGVSSSTIRRTLGEFEARNWVRRDGHTYGATELGAVIATGMEELLDRVETERKVREVWHWLPDEVSEFVLEPESETTVTIADPDYPYRPVNRFESLLQSATAIRLVRPEVALMDPCFDSLCQRVKAGVEITLMDRANCHEYFARTYPDRALELLEHDNFSVLVHDDLPPYGVGLLDGCVVLSCYGEESGTVRALIDSPTQEACTWAETVVSSYQTDAQDWTPTTART